MGIGVNTGTHVCGVSAVVRCAVMSGAARAVGCQRKPRRVVASTATVARASSITGPISADRGAWGGSTLQDNSDTS